MYFCNLDFNLNPTLEAESFKILDLPLSQCRLLNNKNFLWLLLIPRQNNLKELIDLNFEDQIQVLKEINQVSRVLKNISHCENHCEKLNIASLGNIVPQLHIHIIARHSKDIAWPHSPFGNGPPNFYTPEEQKKLIDLILIGLNSHDS